MCVGHIRVLHVVTDSISTVLMRGQLAHLKANGFEVSIASNPGVELDLTALREGCTAFSIPMRREISPISDLRSLFQMYRLLKRIKPAICNCGTPKAGLLTGIAGWLARVPCRVYTLRGLRLETAEGTRKGILTIAEKVACLCANQVVCVSASLRARAIGLRLVSQEKAVLLGFGSSNGVDPERFKPTAKTAAKASKLREEMGIRQDQVVIGFAGRLTQDKGISELVAAFKTVRTEIPGAILLLIGDFEDGDPVRPSIRSAIQSHPGIRHVPNKTQIEFYYHVMDIFVLPSYREGMPNTVLEAQAAGLPVITTMATGAIDSIEDGVTGLLTPAGDVHKLAQALLSLLSDKARMQQMGVLGRERVVREFRSEILWERLAGLYCTLLMQRGLALPSKPSMENAQCAHTP